MLPTSEKIIKMHPTIWEMIMDRNNLPAKSYYTTEERDDLAGGQEESEAPASGTTKSRREEENIWARSLWILS